MVDKFIIFLMIGVTLAVIGMIASEYYHHESVIIEQVSKKSPTYAKIGQVVQVCDKNYNDGSHCIVFSPAIDSDYTDTNSEIATDKFMMLFNGHESYAEMYFLQKHGDNFTSILGHDGDTVLNPILRVPLNDTIVYFGMRDYSDSGHSFVKNQTSYFLGQYKETNYTYTTPFTGVKIPLYEMNYSDVIHIPFKTDMYAMNDVDAPLLQLTVDNQTSDKEIQTINYIKSLDCSGLKEWGLQHLGESDEYMKIAKDQLTFKCEYVDFKGEIK